MVMVKGFKFAVVAAIFLCPFASSHSAFARTFLSYQEAVWMCGTGDLEACDAAHAYEAGPRGAKSGPMSSQDFAK
jgi:hypothetical protein